nr:endopeptidase La [Clostridia bacterium]
SEIEEYYEKIDALKLAPEIEEKLYKEIKKLTKLPFGSAEGSVIKSYLDVCLEFPWKKLTKDRVDIEAASKILERDHDGLEKVKQRILEFLAVKQLNPDVKNQILCLVGPPGTGKTSIVASIAKAMKRKYVRVSLGGVRDEADIRGHRKTYIGAMPGRIIAALTQAGVRNPIILLDEIDKMTRDAHGDPSSALLEVLDAEQNKAFRDHFMELPVDLSECIFIATANTLETVPTPLIDRMEIIELKIYTRHEKLAIAKNHLIPKQMKRHGLNKRMLRITDDAIYELIDFYTREAGVRNLEREIANICRKAAKKLIEDGEGRIDIDAKDISSYLGRRKVKPDRISDEDEVGVVNGLAYTELGGDILKIEASVMPGTGKLELTGSLGDVMKESARTAISYIRAHADALHVDSEFYKTKDIHIHVPEGAVPKDGPSAGVSITTALTSELSGRPVKRDIAMTGEISLRGSVIAIGGLKEKTMAAYQAGVHTVLIPADNMEDLEDIDPTVRSELEFIPCKKLDDVLSRAIINTTETEK